MASAVYHPREDNMTSRNLARKVATRGVALAISAAAIGLTAGTAARAATTSAARLPAALHVTSHAAWPGQHHASVRNPEVDGG